MAGRERRACPLDLAAHPRGYGAFPPGGDTVKHSPCVGGNWQDQGMISRDIGTPPSRRRRSREIGAIVDRRPVQKARSAI
jgi:hypothetical protein